MTPADTLPPAGTGTLYPYYWIGLRKSGVTYWRPDGTSAGNGAVSNANPYAHFSYNYQDVLGGNAALNCTMAHASYAYDNFTGNSSEYLQWQDNRFFASRTGFNK